MKLEDCPFAKIFVVVSQPQKGTRQVRWGPVLGHWKQHEESFFTLLLLLSPRDSSGLRGNKCALGYRGQRKKREVLYFTRLKVARAISI